MSGKNYAVGKGVTSTHPEVWGVYEQTFDVEVGSEPLGKGWVLVANGFTSEEHARKWMLNELDATREWKMPVWMIPYCGTEYLQDVSTVIWHMNNKTPIQVNTPLALHAEHTAGEVRMLSRLHNLGMLCPPHTMEKLCELRKNVYPSGRLFDGGSVSEELDSIIHGGSASRYAVGTLGHLLDTYESMIKTTLTVYERHGEYPSTQRYEDNPSNNRVYEYLRVQRVSSIYDAEDGGIVVIVEPADTASTPFSKELPVQLQSYGLSAYMNKAAQDYMRNEEPYKSSVEERSGFIGGVGWTLRKLKKRGLLVEFPKTLGSLIQTWLKPFGTPDAASAIKVYEESAQRGTELIFDEYEAGCDVHEDLHGRIVREIKADDSGGIAITVEAE